MHAMTASNLRSAFGGESMAHMRYIFWGEKAKEEGFPNVARLFAAVSYAEQVHAGNHFKELRNESGGHDVLAGAGFGIGPTGENLQGAIGGELHEINEMYPAFLAVAQLQEERGAQRSMNWALAAEKIHAAMFQAAKQAVDGGKDYQVGPIQICDNCGYTTEGEAPDKCPVCGVPKDRFKKF